MQKPDLYPRTFIDTAGSVEQTTDVSAIYSTFPNMTPCENTDQLPRCAGGYAVQDCEASSQALRGTLERLPHDKRNEGSTGWVKYEPASTTCVPCDRACNVQVEIQDGQPTEKVRLLYVLPPEDEVIITIG